MLYIDNVSLIYQDGNRQKKVLSNISLNVNENEFISLLGPSGSGKSSLLYILSLLKMPTSGNVYFLGKKVTNYKDVVRLRYENFGFVFQRHYLIPYLSVLENVCVAKYDSAIKKEAEEILDQLGIINLAQKKVFCLSGGEQQRVAIARALVKKPRIIFADEPTASLDHKHATDVMEILNKMKEQSTVICATHDMSILPKNTRQIYIKNDGIEEC